MILDQVNDASPTGGGLLAQLLMAAGGPGAGKEDFCFEWNKVGTQLKRVEVALESLHG